MNKITSLYRFSPIKNKKELLETIEYIHFACNRLCKQSLGSYFPGTGMVGVFCQYEDEYERLVKIQEGLVNKSESINGKYFKLNDPIVIKEGNGIPETIYTHLYIRKPDPYRHHVGDTDFYLEPKVYEDLKESLMSGKIIKGVRIYYKLESNMIELYDPDIDALSYVYVRGTHS